MAKLLPSIILLRVGVIRNCSEGGGGRRQILAILLNATFGTYLIETYLFVITFSAFYIDIYDYELK